MSFTRSILAVAVLAFAAGALAEVTERAAARRLSGLWSAEVRASGYYLYGEFRYNEDGSTSGRGIRVVNGQAERFRFAGTWRIDDDMLIFSENSGGGAQSSRTLVHRDRIETLTDDKLVLVSESGERSVRYRIEYSRLFPR